MTVQLKNGLETEDPRLDRIPQFDERSRAYGIRALDPGKPRSYTWGCQLRTLDQGREGACVGFAWTGELAAKPAVIHGLTNEFAQQVYKEAQLIDEWPGEAYEGTSVLAGAKVLHQRGLIREYRWAFGVDDLAAGVSRVGPAVLGIPWYSSMYSPDSSGYLQLDGSVVGGHAILCVGYNVSGRYFIVQNSWGAAWGIAARARVSHDNMQGLLSSGGEACIPMVR